MNKSDLMRPDSVSVLIVDDNPQNLQVLGKLLKENEYRIEFATNGDGALAWISKKSFDLILLDINMPGMNGFEVCTKIRADTSLRNIPVLFLSAETDRDSILKGFELGAQDYIVKPFDARELLSRVKTHITLKDSLEKLENQNLILEAKVAERTRLLREANEQLNHLNLKLLDLDNAKTEFLRLVSHEIRTPLNGIIGPVELLKESGASREIGELIEILDSSVKRLEKFSLNALLITRLQTKKTDIKIDPVSLETVLSELIEEKAELIHIHGLSINYFNESKREFIKGETELVKTCMGNILDNNLLYVPDNGIVEILIYDEGNYVVCKFVDNGPGFNNEDQSGLFEILSMGNNKKEACLGIGLPICKLIMDAHSGDIQVGNNPGGGAFVKLLFNHE